jgi:hypothetical protein
MLIHHTPVSACGMSQAGIVDAEWKIGPIRTDGRELSPQPAAQRSEFPLVA